jgi:hypothetical protein
MSNSLGLWGNNASVIFSTGRGEGVREFTSRRSRSCVMGSSRDGVMQEHDRLASVIFSSGRELPEGRGRE